MRVWLSDVFAIDTRSLAVFRVGLAVTILGDLANRALDLGAHYTDTGVLPRALLAAEVGSRIPWAPVLLRLQPHFVFGTLPGQALVFAAAAVVAALLLVGWRTRWVTVVSWILLTSLHGRNPGVMNTGDGVLRLLLFWSMFLPLGARWSLDAAARRGPDGYRVIGGGAVALLLQIAFIYVFAAIFKTGAAWTTNYTALEMALGGQWVSAWGERLLQYPELLQLMTRFVIGLERFGWILLFFPFLNGPARTLAVVLFMAFHSGILLCMSISIFAVVCIVAWLAVLPPWFWNTLSGRGDRASSAVVRLPALAGRRCARDHRVRVPVERAVCWGVGSAADLRRPRVSAASRPTVEHVLAPAARACALHGRVRRDGRRSDRRSPQRDTGRRSAASDRPLPPRTVAQLLRLPDVGGLP